MENVEEKKMSLKKKYLKSKNLCKVSFIVPKEAAKDASKITLAGDFNSWDTTQQVLKKLKNGNFQCVVDLEPGQEYQFRYLYDESLWENDWSADDYRETEFGDCDNSVVIV